MYPPILAFLLKSSLDWGEHEKRSLLSIQCKRLINRNSPSRSQSKEQGIIQFRYFTFQQFSIQISVYISRIFPSSARLVPPAPGPLSGSRYVGDNQFPWTISPVQVTRSKYMDMSKITISGSSNSNYELTSFCCTWLGWKGRRDHHPAVWGAIYLLQEEASEFSIPQIAFLLLRLIIFALETFSTFYIVGFYLIKYKHFARTFRKYLVEEWRHVVYHIYHSFACFDFSADLYSTSQLTNCFTHVLIYILLIFQVNYLV